VKALAGDPTFIRKATPTGERKGFGCIDAPRGALAHFSTIDKGKITAYQCVVPYTWNGSPRDLAGNPGATEKALEGVPFDNNIPVYVGPGGP
jgi:Ni,Fe-hydrogenase I large subunit